MCNQNSCSHRNKVSVITTEGVKFIFDSITSKSGHTIYSVCSDCHSNPENFIGVPVQNHIRGASVFLDPSKLEHFSMLLGAMGSPFFHAKDGMIEVRGSSFPSTSGLERVPVKEPTITTRRATRAEYRRRDGIVADLILRQQQFRLKPEEEQQAKEIASAFASRKRKSLVAPEYDSSDAEDEAEPVLKKSVFKKPCLETFEETKNLLK